MEQEEILHTISGKEFKFRIQDRDNINVMSAGYIITPNGEFVDILDSEDHSDIFSRYINNYLENQLSANYSIFKAICLLTSLNHIVYFGVKSKDAKIIYNDLGNAEGFGTVFLPDNIEELTEEQKDSCTKLIATNRSLFGNYDKIQLNFQQVNTHNYLSKDELLDKLTTKISRR